MVCSRCNTPINNETFCPNCGAPVSPNNINQEVSVNNTNQEVPNNFQNSLDLDQNENLFNNQNNISVNSNLSNINTNQNNISINSNLNNSNTNQNNNIESIRNTSTNNNINNTPTQTTFSNTDLTRANKKTSPIIILIVVSLIAIVGLFGGITVKNYLETGNNQEGYVTGKITYDGYEYTIPTGYKAKQDSKYGIIITNDLVYYTLGTDITNSYEAYKNKYIQMFPQEANNIEIEIGGRTFAGITISDTESSEVFTQYATTISSSETLTGIIYVKNSSISQENFTVLNSFIDSRKKTTGDINDLGIEGVSYFDSLNKNIFKN